LNEVKDIKKSLEQNGRQICLILGTKRLVFRFKFNKNTKSRTLATSTIETFRYRLIATPVLLA